MALGGFPVSTAIGTAIVFELLEGPLLDAMPEQFPHHHHDTTRAKIGDLTATMLGYGLIKLLPGR